nr:hypothetical protein Iba_chr12aCG17720 [Ipomoea batatas]
MKQPQISFIFVFCTRIFFLFLVPSALNSCTCDRSVSVLSNRISSFSSRKFTSIIFPFITPSSSET